MGDMTKVLSVLIIAFVSLLLAFAPVADYANVEMSVRLQTAGIITAYLVPSFAALAATSAVRPSWISGGAKKEPVNALAAEVARSVGVSSCRHNVQHYFADRSDLGQISVISGRSPPHRPSRA